MKRYQLSIFFLTLITVISINSLYAETEAEWFHKQAGSSGFYKGRVFLELSGGAAQADITGVALERSKYEIFTDYNIIINSTNQLRRTTSLWKVVDQKKPQSTETNGRFLVEYALYDFLGLGLSYNASSIKTFNYRVSSPLTTWSLPRVLGLKTILKNK